MAARATFATNTDSTRIIRRIAVLFTIALLVTPPAVLTILSTAPVLAVNATLILILIVAQMAMPRRTYHVRLLIASNIHSHRQGLQYIPETLWRRGKSPHPAILGNHHPRQDLPPESLEVP